ncbi:MAG: hypothetical protein AB7O04_04030 [Hyphomonadaceae bacterium]
MRPFLSALLALCLAACAAVPSAGIRRESLAGQIADDAAAFNEAYARAVSGQILLNILRSRDRLPRHYLSMTGIQDSPELAWRQRAEIGAIPLGEGASNWGFGGVGVERESLSRPSYAVQPFSAETLTRTAFEPTQPYVFAHYWRSGWPRDLLWFAMVESFTRIGPDGRAETFLNEANEIFADCTPDIQTRGCAFVRETRAFLAAIAGAQSAPTSRAADALALCGLVEAYAPAQAVRADAPPEGEDCDPQFMAGDVRYVLRLRSLDDIVYYVGELMRAPSMQAGDAALESQVRIRAAGLRGGGRGVPLFRILPAGQAAREAPVAPALHYAASVEYAGVRYYAGPAIGRSCAEAAAEGRCRDDSENGDRSSSVISLIAELMALNQSPDAIRAPNRLIAE